MTDASALFPNDRPIADDDTAANRMRQRDSLFLSTRFIVKGCEPVEARVRNLSEGGVMVEGVPPVEVGTPVAIELRSLGSVPGKIAWYMDRRAGIAFDAPIDPMKVRKPVAVRSVQASRTGPRTY